MENKKCITTYTMLELQAHPSVWGGGREGKTKLCKSIATYQSKNMCFPQRWCNPFPVLFFAYRRFYHGISLSCPLRISLFWGPYWFTMSIPEVLAFPTHRMLCWLIGLPVFFVTCNMAIHSLLAQLPVAWMLLPVAALCLGSPRSCVQHWKYTKCGLTTEQTAKTKVTNGAALAKNTKISVPSVNSEFTKEK